jgi:hypothetical protein
MIQSVQSHALYSHEKFKKEFELILEKTDTPFGLIPSDFEINTESHIEHSP